MCCRVKANCPHVEHAPTVGVPSVRIFLRDLSSYLREFQRKPRKNSNGEVDKRDRGLNPALSVYQLWGQNLSATGGANFTGYLEMILQHFRQWLAYEYNECIFCIYVSKAIKQANRFPICNLHWDGIEWFFNFFWIYELIYQWLIKIKVSNYGADISN